MQYTPHILQKRINGHLADDEFGRPVVVAQDPVWEDVCRCRCDHNGTREVRLDDGTIFVPDWYAVCEGLRPAVAVGDYVRCVTPSGEQRSEGSVKKMQTLNCLPYAKIYF